MIKRGVVDFAVSADWTPAAGDVKISKDGGAAANVTNLPTAITMGNTAMWDYSLTATEMQAAKVRITVADAATKAVEDTFFEIDTYGNASAQHAVDFSDAVRMGLTALPNAAAEAAGGLYTRGPGAGQMKQTANGQIDTNTVYWAGSAVATPVISGMPVASLSLLRRRNTAQTGSANTITLDASAAAVDCIPGTMIYIEGGTGAGQSNTVLSFDATSKIATMVQNWAVLSPDNTSVFQCWQLNGGTVPAQATDVWSDTVNPSRRVTGASTNLPSDTQTVRGQALQGDGSAGNPWRPA